MSLTLKPTIPVVVSLATYAKRYAKLEQSLMFILNQTLVFKTLVINVQDDLTDEEFSKFKHLETYSNRIVVKKRPAKWRSFNKFIHTVREYPDHHIITCDDDIRYPKWMFEELYKEHELHKDHIIAHELNPVDIDRAEHKIMNRMAADIKLKQSCFNKYLTGCCFFPKGIFSEETVRKLEDYDSFYNITRATHDELWMWIHSTLDRIPVIGLNSTWTFDLDGAFPPDGNSLCRINGNLQEVAQYDERINSDERYGRKLYDILNETPVTFRVDNNNLLAVCHCMNIINAIYSDFKIVFDCTDWHFLPSMLRMVVNAANGVKWRRNVTFRSRLTKDFGNGIED